MPMAPLSFCHLFAGFLMGKLTILALTQHALEVIVKHVLNHKVLTKGCADLILEDIALMKFSLCIILCLLMILNAGIESRASQL